MDASHCTSKGKFCQCHGRRCRNTQYKLLKKGGKIMDLHVRKQHKSTNRLCLYKQEWKKSAINCEAYSSFEGVSTDHRIVMAKIRLSLRRNATRTATTKHFKLYTHAKLNCLK